MGKRRVPYVRFVGPVALLVGLAMSCEPSANAQSMGNPQVQPSSPTRSANSEGDSSDLMFSRDNPGLRERMERSRQTERQKKIVDDAKRLVELTALYRRAVQAHGTPTDDDQKLLLQIEKLARDVRDRMKGV